MVKLPDNQIKYEKTMYIFFMNQKNQALGPWHHEHYFFQCRVWLIRNFKQTIEGETNLCNNWRFGSGKTSYITLFIASSLLVLSVPV